MEQADAWRLTDRVAHELGKGDPFAAAVRATRMAMIITDPRQSDNPIVFANDAFLNLTGYRRDEVMGRNCRFLQGAETDRHVVKQVAERVRAGRDINVDLLNYRKDGSSFWNALYVSPVFSDAGELQYFFASQLDVTERIDLLAARTALLREVDHRVKNNLQMMSSVLSMQSQNIDDPQAKRAIGTTLSRISTMFAVHQRIYQSNDVTRLAIADFIPEIVSELVGAAGRGDIRVQLELEPCDISAERAASLALVVNELVTNVLKHALPVGRPGVLAVRARQRGERLRIEVEDDGLGMPAPSSTADVSFGHRLVSLLARKLRASLAWSSVEPSGTKVALDVPVE